METQHPVKAAFEHGSERDILESLCSLSPRLRKKEILTILGLDQKAIKRVTKQALPNNIPSYVELIAHILENKLTSEQCPDATIYV